MMIRTILFLMVLWSALIESAHGYPIPPRNLRGLVLDSELIVVANVVETEELKQKDDHWHDWKAGLQTTSVLKGAADSPSVSVYYTPNMLCPQPARYEKGRRVLAFLNPRKQGDGYTTYALSYGTKNLSAADLKVYVERINELLAIEKESDEDRRNGLTVEWMLKCAEHPATRWEGLHALRWPRYRPVKKGEKPKEEPAFYRLLGNDQKRRLLHLLKTFLEHPEENVHDHGMLMSILAKSEESQEFKDILQPFYKISWKDPGKHEKRKAIVATFIKAYENLIGEQEAGDGDSTGHRESNDPTPRQRHDSFIVSMPDGAKYVIRPIPEKLREADLAIGPASDFERLVRERLTVELKKRRDLKLEALVVGTIRARNKQGGGLPPLRFKLGELALVRPAEQ